MSAGALRGALAAFSGEHQRHERGWSVWGHTRDSPELMCDPADYAGAADYAAVAENLLSLSPQKRHRRKIPTCAFPENLFVARPVGKREILENPKAQAALQVEWGRLRGI
eukprot:10547295-Alexandrium_andersonii.AAC.1